jgi:hypothetical protein
LAALLSLAVLAMVLAAQTSLSCTDKLAIPVPATMPSMPGMDMAAMQGPLGHQAMLICPVVLGLITTSALLIAAAALMWWRDPHRALLQRSILAALAGLPALQTAAAVALIGAGAVVAMLRLEHSAPPAVPVCAMLLALLVACALVATVFAIACGRIAIAFGRRLMLAIVAAIAQSGEAGAAHRGEIVSPLTSAYRACLLAAGRGLRAPPSFVR